MDAATLRVLVEVNGVRRATQELRNVDTAGTRAARSASKMGDGFDDSDRSARRASKGFAGLADAFGGGNNGARRMARGLDMFGGAAGGATATIGGFKIAIAAIVPMIMGFGGAAVSAGASLGPLIGLAAAAGNAFAAAAQGVGVFKLAIMGIGGALKEQIDNQSKAGGAAASNASAQRAAANAIQSAQEGVSDSMRSLSDAQLDHQQAVKGLAPAYTEARRALVDMQAGVKDAVLNEASLALGLRDARKALDELIRGASPLDIADAQDAVADSTRNAQRAVLDLSDAQKGLNTVLADPASTGDDIARARLTLQDAENAVSDARRDAVKAAMDLADLEKPASSDALAEARLRVAQAENDLVNARRDRVRQQKDLNAAEAAGIAGSKEVVEARQAIADAERRVSDARRDVVRSQRALNEAQLSSVEASKKAAAGAANMNEEFNKLPPAAQKFVRVLQGMKPKLDELRATAASGFFPGATKGLQAAMGSFDSVKKVIGETATVLGDAARKSGELVGSPAFGRDIEKIGHNNAVTIGTLGEALRHVVSALRHVMVAAGPLTKWLADLVNKWALNAASAAKSGRETGKMADFFEKTRVIASRLGSIIKNVSEGLLGLGKAAKGSGDDIWASIDRAAEKFNDWANSAKGQKELKDFFERTKDLAGALATAIGGVSRALAFMSLKMLPITTALKLAGPYADEVTVAFVSYKLAIMGVGVASSGATVAMTAATFATGGWTTAFWALNASMVANPIGLTVLAILGLVAVFVLAWKHSETFRNIVTGAWDAVKTTIVDRVTMIVDAVTTAWNLISSVTIGQWGAIKGFLMGAWNALRSAATSVFNAIASVISGVWSAISTTATAAWNAIRSAATTAWNAVRDAVINPLGAARDRIGEILNSIREKLSEAWSAVSSRAKDAWDSVKNAITGAVSGAYEVVTGTIKKFTSIGEDIIRGIVKGIRETAGNVIDAIKDAITDKLPKFVKKALGIKSPSRVFADLGRQVSLGMAQGISSEAGKVTAAMGQITQIPTVAGGAIGAMGYITPPVSPYVSSAAPLSASEGMSREDALIASNNRLANRLDALLASGVSVVTLTDEVGSSLGNQAQARSMTAGNPNTTAINY